MEEKNHALPSPFGHCPRGVAALRVLACFGAIRPVHRVARHAGAGAGLNAGAECRAGRGNSASRYDFISLRGQTYNGALFLDGMRASFGVCNLSLPQVDPYLLERVEVARGPGSALYGQSLPGGLANAISKRPQDEPQRQIGLTLGNRQKRELRLDVGGAADQGRVAWRLAGLARAENNQIAHVSSRRVALAPSLRWRINAQTELTLLASYQRDPRGGYYGGLPAQGVISALPDGRFVPRRFFMGDPAFDRFSRTQSTLGYDFSHELASGWTLRHTLRRIASQADVQGMAVNALVPPATLSRSALHADSRTQALMTDTALEGQARTGSVAHRLLLGLDHMRSRLSQRMGMNLLTVPPIDMRRPAYGQVVPVPDSPATAHLWSDTRDHVRQTGFYVQDQMQRASLLMGQPTDATSRQSDRAFSGRAAATWRFAPHWAAYASHATSFLPQAGLMADGRAYRPLKSRQWEAGLKYALEDGAALLGVTLFDIRQKNALTPDPDPTHRCAGLMGLGTCMVQAGRQRTRGLELEGKAALASGTFAHGSFTRLDAKITASTGADLGKRPVNVPRAMAALWLERAFTPALRLGVGAQHVGATRADAANTLRVPGHTLLDAALHYAINPHLTLAARAANVLDRRYAVCESSAYCNWGQARTLSVDVLWQW